VYLGQVLTFGRLVNGGTQLRVRGERVEQADDVAGRTEGSRHRGRVVRSVACCVAFRALPI